MTYRRISVDELKLSLEEKQNRNGQIQAIFFDLDGTLIDTMNLHYRAYHETFKELGGYLSREDFDFHSGPPATITIPLFANACGLKLSGNDEIKNIHAKKKEIFENFLSDSSLPLLPAVDIMIEWFGKVPVSVVTSGNARGAAAILRASGIFHYANAIITADDVKRGKPHPEPYLLALAQSNVDPRRSVAFEDHNNGIQSATLARLDVVDVRTGCLIDGEKNE